MELAAGKFSSSRGSGSAHSIYLDCRMLTGVQVQKAIGKNNGINF